MRLRAVAVSVLAALPLLLAACGSDGSDGSAPTGGEAAAGAGAFPVTVTHKYGATVVPEQPKRVVSVGVTEQDVLLQLGVVPVGVTEWYGEQPDATWPWAHDLLGGAHPEVLSVADGFEFEKIAALEPDLIVGTNAGLTKKDYRLLSAIAPTVTSDEDATAFFSPWQDQVLQIARALGREDDGQEVVDDTEAAYAKVAAAHPEWADRTATFSQGGPYDGVLYVYPAGLSTSFLTEVGFTMTTGLEKYAPDQGSQAEISAENVGLIDADVVVFATEDQEMFDGLQRFGTIGSLPAVAGKRAVYTDGTLAGALYFDTPLARTYALERLTPLLEQAAAGTAPRAFPS
ncbi:ABC transporter substrate-binding protein [Nocardioides sp. URHA0020]|uniref:ABC transporter substrate-binding protein n=1 Tax=Nocardioides sp. URHA0020 TaxID=1380392 RepID=UPI0009E011B3|nr:ABC transporter substrate-binding protein [Nocardioides sp. URHA0020]